MKRILIFILMAALIAAVAPVASAQDFALVGPTGSTLVREKSVQLASFSWTPLAAATGYQLSVFKVSTNPRAGLGELFTQAVAPGSCSGTLCVHVTSGGQLALFDTGEYAWTVVAATAGGEVEASNGAIFFSYNPDDVALLINGDFETGTLSPWVGGNLSADKLKSTVGNGGTWGFEFKGSSTEQAVLKQNVLVQYYGIKFGDTLDFRLDYKAANASVNAKISAKIIYTPASGLTPNKVKLVASQHANFFTASTTAAPNGPVKKIQVTVINNSTSGKFYVDNIELTLNGQP